MRGVRSHLAGRGPGERSGGERRAGRRELAAVERERIPLWFSDSCIIEKRRPEQCLLTAAFLRGSPATHS